MLGPKRGLVDVAGGLRLVKERRAPPRAGEREPAPVGARAGQVGDEYVGVERRVAGARGAVAEGHREEAAAGLDAGAAVAALDEAGAALEVGDRLGDGAVVGAGRGRPRTSGEPSA